MAHQLGRAVLEAGEDREEILKADVAGVLELAGEVIRRSHALRTVLVALLWRVRAGRGASFARQLADRPGERGIVVNPMVGVHVRGLAPDKLSRARELSAVFHERFAAIDRARE